MRAYQDAFGTMLYDCLRGRKVACEIIERSDGLMDAYPSNYFVNYAKWSKHEKQAIRYAKGRVLDVGAGAGRVSLYLQDKGCDVLGIDISPLAVKVCKLRGIRKAKVMSITELSPRLGAFDTIVMYGNNFGLFGDRQRARQLLRRFHVMTSPGARLIVESNDIYKTNNPDHLAYQKSNRSRGRMSGQIRLRVLYRKLRTPWIDYLMVSREEMKDILSGTGWKVQKFFDSDNSMYTAVIRKEGAATCRRRK
jgi:SAM-dependent methyltransferase